MAESWKLTFGYFVALIGIGAQHRARLYSLPKAQRHLLILCLCFASLCSQSLYLCFMVTAVIFACKYCRQRAMATTMFRWRKQPVPAWRQPSQLKPGWCKSILCLLYSGWLQSSPYSSLLKHFPDSLAVSLLAVSQNITTKVHSQRLKLRIRNAEMSIRDKSEYKAENELRRQVCSKRSCN